jgi:hypothetical protein
VSDNEQEDVNRDLHGLAWTEITEATVTEITEATVTEITEVTV